MSSFSSTLSSPSSFPSSSSSLSSSSVVDDDSAALRRQFEEERSRFSFVEDEEEHENQQTQNRSARESKVQTPASATSRGGGGGPTLSGQYYPDDKEGNSKQIKKSTATIATGIRVITPPLSSPLLAGGGSSDSSHHGDSSPDHTAISVSHQYTATQSGIVSAPSFSIPISNGAAVPISSSSMHITPMPMQYNLDPNNPGFDNQYNYQDPNIPIDPNKITWKSKAFILSVFILIIIFFVYLPYCALFIPILFIPLGILALYRKRYAAQASWDAGLKISFIAFWPGMIIAAGTEMILSLIFILICFSSKISKWWDQLQEGKPPNDDLTNFPLEMDRDFSLYAFIFLLSFVGAAGVEESLKYVCFNYARKWQPMLLNPSVILWYGMMGALGFSIIENFGYVYSECSESSDDAGDELLAGFLGSVTRAFMSTTVHVSTAYLMGIGFIRRDLLGERMNSLKILAYPVWWHGIFDFLLFTVAASKDDLGESNMTAISAVIAVVILGGLLVHIYIQRKKYLVRFDGFSQLPMDEQPPIQMQQLSTPNMPQQQQAMRYILVPIDSQLALQAQANGQAIHSAAAAPAANGPGMSDEYV